MTRKMFGILALVIVLIGGGVTVFFLTRHHQNPPSSPSSPSTNSTTVSYATCPTAKPGTLKNSPVAVSDLSTIIPMGNFAPPGHIGATPHMYYNFLNVGAKTAPVPAKTNIYAPADLTITKITLFDNASAANPFNSYRIDFTVCQQVTGYFIHVVTLSDQLAAVMKPPYDKTQTSQVGGTVAEHTYEKSFTLKLRAGDLIGTSGGAADRPAGLDFGLVDTRSPEPITANPARWKFDNHYVCSLDYYPSDISATLYNHIGDYSFAYLNPGDPKCGTIYQDLPGTAQGTWFTPEVPKDTLGDPAQEVVLAHSNFDHSKAVFSLGNRVQSDLGISANATYTFTPKASGNVNVDFNKVTPGAIYCYELANPTNFTAPPIHLLLQLTDAQNLRFGSLSATSCGSGPWTFTKYIDYVR